MIDVKARKVVYESNTRDFWNKASQLLQKPYYGSSIGQLQMSPDGKSLLVAESIIAKFQIRDDGPVIDSVSALQSVPRRGVRFSHDGQWCLVQRHSRDPREPKWFPEIERPVFLLDTGDLSEPKHAIPQSSNIAAIDPVKNNLFTFDHSEFLNVKSLDGKLKLRIENPTKFSTSWNVPLVSPVGDAILMLGRDRSFWVRLTDQRQAAKLSPKKVTLSVKGEESRVAGGAGFAVDVKGQDLASDPLFSADGSRLFLAMKDGAVKVLSVPEFNVIGEIDLRQSLHALTLTKHGLLVGGTSGVDLLDEETLEHKHRFLTSSSLRLTGSPAVSVAFGTNGKSSSDFHMVAFDLENQKLLYRIDNNALYEIVSRDRSANRPSVVAIDAIRMTPNGKHLFTLHRDLWRFRIEPDELVYETYQRTQSVEPRFIDTSSDSRFALVAGRHNTNRGGSGLKAILFDTVKFDTPIAAVPFEPRRTVGGQRSTGSSVAAIEPKTNNIYVLIGGTSLYVYGQNGEKRFQLTVPKHDRLVISPKPGQILLVGENQSTWLTVE